MKQAIEPLQRELLEQLALQAAAGRLVLRQTETMIGYLLELDEPSDERAADLVTQLVWDDDDLPVDELLERLGVVELCATNLSEHELDEAFNDLETTEGQTP